MKSVIQTTALILIALSTLTCNAYSADYFPLKKGMSWEYRYIVDGGILEYSKAVTADSYKIGEVKTVPVRYDFGRVEFMLKNNEGVFNYAQQAPDEIDPKIFEEKKITLLNPIKLGTSWKRKENMYLMFKKDGRLKEKHDIEFDITIDKTDQSIITPAGVFDNCIRIKWYAEKDVNYETGLVLNNKINAKVKIERYIYFAPNIGLVKSFENHLLEEYNSIIVSSKYAVNVLTKFTN